MTDAPAPFSSRIAGAFAKARSQGRKTLILYLTGCDPDFDTSRRLLLAAARAGRGRARTGGALERPFG